MHTGFASYINHCFFFFFLDWIIKTHKPLFDSHLSLSLKEPSEQQSLTKITVKTNFSLVSMMFLGQQQKKRTPYHAPYAFTRVQGWFWHSLPLMYEAIKLTKIANAIVNTCKACYSFFPKKKKKDSWHTSNCRTKYQG